MSPLTRVTQVMPGGLAADTQVTVDAAGVAAGTGHAGAVAADPAAWVRCWPL